MRPVIGDRTAIALTLWGEARGERVEGRIAVACILRNRLRLGRSHWGRTYVDVCLSPYQFSCWNEDDPNHKLLIDLADQVEGGLIPDRLTECLWIADGLIADTISERVGACTHYHADSMTPPNWAKDKTALHTIGHHLFYSGIR